ncbi:MAG: SRPBCC domain-containing protein [Silicimonas sp.]|nr:SRPBCC domain-containing protein [Silicimonas sp.]
MNRMTMVKTGDTALTVTRRFNADPAAVFKAHTDEAIVRTWMLGPPGWTMPDCTLDATPGGAFSYTWAHPDEGSFTIHGTFLELDPPNRIFHKEVMEMGDETPPAAQVETRFEADPDGTLMTMTITYASAEQREAAVASGMEDGMAFSYDTLEKALASA